jgi:hypothetical protein
VGNKRSFHATDPFSRAPFDYYSAFASRIQTTSASRNHQQQQQHTMTIKNNDAATSSSAEEEIVVDAPIAVATAIPVTTNYAVPDTTNYAASAVDTTYAVPVPSSKPPATTSPTTTTSSSASRFLPPSSRHPGRRPLGNGQRDWTRDMDHLCCCFLCVLFFFTLLPCGLFALLCPCDRGDVYAASGRVYDIRGKYMGPASRFNMTPLAHGR